jgi:hypothetical protein
MREIKTALVLGFNSLFEEFGYTNPLVRTDLARVLETVAGRGVVFNQKVVGTDGSKECVLNFCGEDSLGPNCIKSMVFRPFGDNRPSLVIETKDNTDTLPRIDAVFFNSDDETRPEVRFCWQRAVNEICYIDICFADNGLFFS